MNMKKNNIVFYHVWIPNDERSLFWYWWVGTQLEWLRKSGLGYEAEVRVYITMPATRIKDYKNIEFITQGGSRCDFGYKVREFIFERFPFVDKIIIRGDNEENIYEGSTLSQIYYESHLRDGEIHSDNFLYIHTKGICSASPHAWVWLEYLNKNLIGNYKECISMLNNYDVVGIKESRYKESDRKIMSGNMFWTRTEYIQTLCNPVDMDLLLNEFERYKYERWILNNPAVRPGYIKTIDVDPFIQYIS